MMNLSFFKNSRKNDGRSDLVDALVRAARETDEPETLSAERRDGILRAALCHDSADEPLPSMFTPTRRLLVAGALPAVLAVALLAGFDREVRAPKTVLDTPPVVAVSKQGDQVLFNITNGSRQHRVYRSTDPNRFDAGTAVPVTDGAYVDPVDDQSKLVFYRID